MIKSLKNIFENFEDIANDIQTIKLDNNEYIVLKKTTKNTNAVINALSVDNNNDLYTNNILNSKNSINNDIKPKTDTKKTETKTDTKKTETKIEDTTSSSEKTSSSTKLMWVLFGLGIFILVIIIIMFIRYLMTRNNSNSTENQSINQTNGETDIVPSNLQNLANETPIKNNIDENLNKSQSVYKIPSKPSSNNNDATDTVIESIKTPESLSISQRTKELLKTYSPQNDNTNNTDNKSKSFSSLFSFSKNSKTDDVNKIDNVVKSTPDNDGNDGNDGIKKVGGKNKYNYKKTYNKKITNNINPKRTYVKRTYVKRIKELNN